MVEEAVLRVGGGVPCKLTFRADRGLGIGIPTPDLGRLGLKFLCSNIYMLLFGLDDIRHLQLSAHQCSASYHFVVSLSLFG